jgi:hypothetical protein
LRASHISSTPKSRVPIINMREGRDWSKTFRAGEIIRGDWKREGSCVQGIV